jgi:hypothetical protein
MQGALYVALAVASILIAVLVKILLDLLNEPAKSGDGKKKKVVFFVL